MISKDARNLETSVCKDTVEKTVLNDKHVQYITALASEHFQKSLSGNTVHCAFHEYSL